ncbi:CobW C-terminal domain-containing protein, partial [Haematococcus lacustris]
MSEDEDSPPEAVPLPLIERTQPRKQPVPVTLITGKSTLVRHVLQSDHGLKIAVIINEYGEGVENAYFSEDLESLRSASGEWVQLDNGCMCCSVKNDFVKALEALLAKEQQPDYILIETTGLANPGPVAAALWTDEEIEAGVQLDSIITVVDVLNINRQLHEPRGDGAVNEAQVQIAYADLILLNKIDLCGEDARARAEADIRAINSSVCIMRTSRCAIDLALLLNRHGYKHGAEVQMPSIAEDEEDDSGAEDDGDEPPEASGDGEEDGIGEDAWSREGAVANGEAPCPAKMTRPSTHVSLGRASVGGQSSHSRAMSLKLEDNLGSSDCDEPGHHHHDPVIQTVCLRSSQPLSLERLKSFLDKVLWDRETHPEDIYRVKGVVQIQGDPRKHMVQAVYELYSIAPSIPWLPEEQPESRVVIIGRNLKKSVLVQWFEGTAA